MKKRKNPMYPNWQDGGPVPIPKYIAPNKEGIRNPSLYSEEFRQMYNPDEAVRNWHIDYINSPKYKERLRKQGYTNPNQVIHDRRERIQKAIIVPQLEKDVGSAYSSTDNKVFMDNDQVSDIGTTRDDILSHEMGHIINSSVDTRLNPNFDVIEDISNTSLNENEERYIGSRNKNVGDRLVYVAKENSVKYNKTISHILSEIDHDYSPYESKSDMDSFRYMLKQEGIYDAGKEDFTPDILKKARSNKAIKKSFNSKRLFKNFSDKDLIDIMNNVALNNNLSTNTAKFGRKMYAEGGKSEEPTRRRRSSGPNVTDPTETPKAEGTKPFAPYAPTGVPIYNYTPAQGDNPNIAPTVPTNPIDQDVYEWTRNYIQSPKYQERLSNFYKYPEYIQRQRAQKASTVGFLERLADNSGYVDNSSFPNQLNINPNQLNAIGASRAEVAAHELGHISNASDSNPALRINPIEENYILSRNKTIRPDQIPEYRRQAQEAGFPNISNYWTDERRKTSESHDAAPSENLSDVQALRYLLNKNKIYDARVQDITPEQLQRAKQNKEIMNSFSTKRLFDTFDDKGLIDILNKVATNNTNSLSPMAKNGKKIKNNNYGGKMPPAYRNGGFVNGNMFQDTYPNYISNYNGVNGIPPKVYEFGGQAPSDAIPVQGPFPYQTYGTQSGYGQIPPPKVYADGGSVGDPIDSIEYKHAYKSAMKEIKKGNINDRYQLYTTPSPYMRYIDEAGRRATEDAAKKVGDQNRGVQQLNNFFGVTNNTSNTSRTANGIPLLERFFGLQPNELNYANGGIVPTSNSFAASPFPRDYMYETYPSYVSEYPRSPTDPVAYLQEAESGIHIKPENRGKFNATKKRTGKTTEELTHSKNPKTRKRAIFAQNAATWDHAANGGGPYGDILPIYNPMNINADLQNAPIAPYNTSPVPQTGMAPYTDDEVASEGNYEQSQGRGIANAIGGALGGMTFNTSAGIMGLGALSNAFTAQQDAVNTSAMQTRRNVASGPIYNPYKYGTGSSALFANGGSITDDNAIQQAIMTLRNAGYDIEMD